MNYRVRLTSLGKFLFVIVLVVLAVVGHQFVEKYKRMAAASQVLAGLVVLDDGHSSSVIRISIDEGETWAEFRKTDGRFIGPCESQEGGQGDR